MNFIATMYKEDDNLRNNNVFYLQKTFEKQKKTFELGLYCSKQHLAHLFDGTKNIISFPKKQHS